jgi:GDPmannose 4,6-dehydratase
VSGRSTRTHLVTGVSGQDGVWLSRLLVGSGDQVVGTTRDGSAGSRGCYLAGVELEALDVRDRDAFADLVERVEPDVVHNLAAMTSVGASWEAAEEVSAVDATAVEAMLDVLLATGANAPAFVHASSSEIFGPADPSEPVDERTAVRPVSPYGEAKARAHAAVQAARDAGLRATNLVLFGHTSALHATRFAIPSLARQAAEVGLGRRERVTLRNPDTRRDWGSAQDFVHAFVAAADADPGDFVIATGELHTLAELGRWALDAAGAPKADVTASGDPGRPHDFDNVRGDAGHAARALGWSPRRTIRAEVEHMVSVELRRLRTGVADADGYLDPV